VLENFCSKIRTGGPGWRKIERASNVKNVAFGWDVPMGLLCMMVGCLSVWTALFGIGYLLFGEFTLGCVLLLISVVSTFGLMRLAGKIQLS